MKVEFKVHGTSMGNANMRADVDGETLTGTVPCFEVELTTVAERSGTLTLRFVGSSIDGAKELFSKDAMITADFSSQKKEEKKND